MAFDPSQASIRFSQEMLEGSYYSLVSWNGREEYHTISEQIVVIRSKNGNLKLSDFFLKPAAVEIDAHVDKNKISTRQIKGIIRKVGVEADETNQFLYTFRIVPQLWRLSQRINSRIFQELNSKEIVEQILQEYGIPFEMKIKNTPRKREYCVQFQESDLNFISRLAEDDGFYYFFNQAEDKVIFIDDPSKIEETAPLKEFAWDPGEGLVQLVPETIIRFEVNQQPRWNNVLVKDYNYRTPEADLLKQSQVGGGEGSAYMYLTGHTNAGEGERIAKLRLEEHRAQMDVVSVESTIRSVATGYRFKFIEFPASAYNIEYQITKVEHRYYNTKYSNSFECIPLSTPFRALRKTLAPRIYGLQTATVVGPSGYRAKGNSAEDLYVDEMGRIKILFHWDLDVSRNEKSSCWVRLMREYAGPNYGIYFLPRIGNEVLVSFLEGNPDYPVVVGSVHHADNIPPIQEPADKTQNTLLMPTTNELKFEDKEGQELVYMHAQKDHTRKVENDESITVGHDRSKSVSNNETTSIGVDRTETVGNNETITIQANRTESVIANETISIGGNRTESVMLDETIAIDGKKTVTVKGDTKISITEGKLDHDVVSNDAHYHVKGAVTEEFDLNQKTTVNNEIEIVSKTAHIHVTAASEIKLEVGRSKLFMKSDGSIELSGLNIAIDGAMSVNIHGTSVTSKADADHNTQGTIVLSEGAATNTVKGGMVMLNP